MATEKKQQISLNKEEYFRFFRFRAICFLFRVLFIEQFNKQKLKSLQNTGLTTYDFDVKPFFGESFNQGLKSFSIESVNEQDIIDAASCLFGYEPLFDKEASVLKIKIDAIGKLHSNCKLYSPSNSELPHMKLTSNVTNVVLENCAF